MDKNTDKSVELMTLEWTYINLPAETLLCLFETISYLPGIKFVIVYLLLVSFMQSMLLWCLLVNFSCMTYSYEWAERQTDRCIIIQSCILNQCPPLKGPANFCCICIHHQSTVSEKVWDPRLLNVYGLNGEWLHFETAMNIVKWAFWISEVSD